MVTGPYAPPSVSGIGMRVRLAQGVSSDAAVVMSAIEQFGCSVATQASNETGPASAPASPPAVLLLLPQAVIVGTRVPISAMALSVFMAWTSRGYGALPRSRGSINRRSGQDLCCQGHPCPSLLEAHVARAGFRARRRRTIRR